MNPRTIISVIQILLAIIFTFILVKANLDLFSSILFIIPYFVIMTIINRVSRKYIETWRI